MPSPFDYMANRWLEWHELPLTMTGALIQDNIRQGGPMATAKYMKLKLTSLSLMQVVPAEGPPTATGAQLVGVNNILDPSDPRVKEVLSASLYGVDEETRRSIYLDIPAEMLGDSHNLGDEFILIFKRIDR